MDIICYVILLIPFALIRNILSRDGGMDIWVLMLRVLNIENSWFNQYLHKTNDFEPVSNIKKTNQLVITLGKPRESRKVGK